MCPGFLVQTKNIPGQVFLKLFPGEDGPFEGIWQRSCPKKAELYRLNLGLLGPDPFPDVIMMIRHTNNPICVAPCLARLLTSAG